MLIVVLTSPAFAQQQEGPPTLQQLWSRGRAEGNWPVKLSRLPLREADIGSIGPLGMMMHGHVAPITPFFAVASVAR